MSKNDDDNTMVTVAAVGGGALALWLLLRGRGGWGLGGGGGGADGATERASATVAADGGKASRPNGPPCKVVIRPGKKVELNGVETDLASVVASCRAVGNAEVRGSGALVVGEVRDVVLALNAADVAILPVGHPDIVATIRDSLAGRYGR